MTHQIVVNKKIYIWVTLGWLFNFYLIWDGVSVYEENEVLKAELKDVIQRHNSANHTAKFYQERNQELSGAVEALMNNCTDTDVVRSIKDTPLPKLVK